METNKDRKILPGKQKVPSILEEFKKAENFDAFISLSQEISGIDKHLKDAQRALDNELQQLPEVQKI